MTDTDIEKVDAKAMRTQRLAHPGNIRLMMDSRLIVAQIGRCFPGDIEDDRRGTRTRALLEQVYVHIVNSKACDKILGCTGDSVIQAITEVASLDLSLTRASGECYLIPFKAVCTLMVGYRGFIKLIVNTGAVSSVTSTLVYEGEPFEWHNDETGSHWDHKPNIDLQGQAAKVKAAYAVGWVRSGPPIFEPMNRAELDKVRKASKKPSDGPWAAWTTEMFRKAPIRRMQKRIPQLAENRAGKMLQRAIELDNQQYTIDEVGRHQQMLEDHSREMIEAEDKPLGDAPPAEEPERAEDGQIIPADAGLAADDVVTTPAGYHPDPNDP